MAAVRARMGASRRLLGWQRRSGTWPCTRSPCALSAWPSSSTTRYILFWKLLTTFNMPYRHASSSLPQPQTDPNPEPQPLPQVVGITGTNFFFKDKPAPFHDTCRRYALLTGGLQLAFFMIGGWKAIAYLTLSEVAWQLPTHPACSMFVSNHGSVTEHPQGSVAGEGGGGTAFSSACQPSTSVYVGGAYSWYDFLCGFSVRSCRWWLRGDDRSHDHHCA